MTGGKWWNGPYSVVTFSSDWFPADEQVEAVRRLIAQQVPWTEHPFLKVGQHVRIRGGSLDGIKGVLFSRDRGRTLIISLDALQLDALQRSLAVRIEGYDVEPV